MKALLISPSSAPGGAERAFVSLARQLPKYGIDCRAVLFQSGPLEGWLESADCEVDVIDAGRTRQVHRTAYTIGRLTQIARNADVVVSNQSKGQIYGGLASYAARRPSVWWQQGIPGPSTIENIAGRIPVDLVIASSEPAVQAQRLLTPNPRVELVHLGIDTGAVRLRSGSGAAIRASNGWDDQTLVGIVGRLQEWKGQDVFLRAMAQLARTHADTEFVVVGGAVLGWEGDYPERLQTLAAELGIRDQVHFVGHQDDVYPWFDALDIVVHASYDEPFGLVLIEAMALGKPLVAAAAGGPLEIIEDGVSGCLVPPGDHEAMADAISKLLQDEHLRHRVENAAAVRAEMFDEARMAKHVAELLHEVAGVARDARSEPSPALVERSVPGLHQHVFDHVVRDLPLGTALDVGAGTGAFAERLARCGHEVLAADLDPSSFQATTPFKTVDLNSSDWGRQVGEMKWSLVTAIEVIEHLENPIGFLRDLGRLLTPDGVAIVTTPNVDSLPARLKFLLRGRIRMLDEWGDPTHISPVFWDLLNRKYLPLAGLALREHLTYPVDGFCVGRRAYRPVLRGLGLLFRRRRRLLGDNHIFVLTHAGPDPTLRAPG